MTTRAVRSVRSPRTGRSRPLKLSVIGLDRVVGVSLDVVPRGRDQLVERRRVDRRRFADGQVPGDRQPHRDVYR